MQRLPKCDRRDAGNAAVGSAGGPKPGDQLQGELGAAVLEKVSPLTKVDGGICLLLK